MKKKRDVFWVDLDKKVHAYEFSDYMIKVGQARHVVRKVYMLIDDCAREYNLVPLEHQTLIQIYGARDQGMTVGHIAERLNVVQAQASRLVQQLETAGLVRRIRSKEDRRAIFVHITTKGEKRLYDIVEKAHERMDTFRSQVAPEERQALHEIIAFYVGGAEPRRGTK